MENPSPVSPVTPVESSQSTAGETKENGSICSNCKNQFNLVKRKHHCHQCERLLCSNCLPNKMSGERVCDQCVLLTSSLADVLISGFENLWWTSDDNKVVWEPVLIIEAENLDERGSERVSDSMVFGRAPGNNYRSFDRSHLLKKPIFLDKMSAHETIKTILKAYIDLCGETGVTKGRKVAQMKDGKASEVEIAKIVCKDGVIQGVELKGANGDVIPMEQFQTVQIIPNGKGKMDEHVAEVVKEYDNLRQEFRQNLEEYLTDKYVIAFKDWSSNFTRQKIEETLMEILLESYTQMEIYKLNTYQRLADVLSFSHVFMHSNTQERENELDKLVLNHLFHYRKALFAAHEVFNVNSVYESALKKFVSLEETGKTLMKEYVQACCEVCWGMQLISPKMKLLPSTSKTDEKSENDMATALHEDDYEAMPGSNPTSTTVLYYVWPALAWNNQRVPSTRIYCVIRDAPFPRSKEEEQEQTRQSSRASIAPKFVNEKMMSPQTTMSIQPETQIVEPQHQSNQM